MLFIHYNIKQIRLAYLSKHSSDRKNQVILLMITDGKKWHYLLVKRLSALLNKIACNYEGGFYCLNCFYFFKTENELTNMKMYVKIMNIAMYKCQIKIIIY